MQLQNPFDARSVDPSAFAPPPPMGDYHVRIIESEGKPTASNDGGYLELTLEILDPGPYLNRHVPYRLNLFNKSQQTVEIAYRQLSAVCYVTNVIQIQDSRQLHNIPFIAIIGPQKDNPQYSNVFGVKDINGNLPGKAAPAAPASAPTFAAPAPVAAAPAPAWGPPAPAPAPAAPAPAPAAWQPQPAQPAPTAAPAAAPWSPGAQAPAAAPPWAR